MQSREPNYCRATNAICTLSYIIACCWHSLLSLIAIFSFYLFVLTNFDSSRRHTHATTLVREARNSRQNDVTWFDFCFAGETSRALAFSLAGLYRRKKSTARTSHLWKKLSSTFKQVYISKEYFTVEPGLTVSNSWFPLPSPPLFWPWLLFLPFPSATHPRPSVSVMWKLSINNLLRSLRFKLQQICLWQNTLT